VNLGSPYVNISGNVMDCLDNESVKAACITSAEEDDSPKKLWIYLDGIGLIIQSEEVLQLNIYDVNGKWVKSWDHLSEGTLLDVSFLAAGLYVVQTANLAGHLSSGKLVKSI
ncbi:MAG TPA: T9SS type A sorting domain-containing protein, partial [Saprospiraceae bacterium]|nr:T9SS type A sorting domain-containing protein [Saprospiraceae bacterium]